MTPETEDRKFVIEISVDKNLVVQSAADDNEAADELMDAIASASLPAWVFSVNEVNAL